MGSVAHDRVVFLDPAVVGPGPAGGPPGTGGAAAGPDAVRPRSRSVALAVTAVAALLVGARALGAPPPVLPAVVVAAEVPVYGGQVTLPAGFGAPVQVATATAVDADVLWVLGDRGQVVRVEGGEVTVTSAARGYHALAVRPDAGTVFVSTGEFAPTVVALDPLTLEPRASVLAAAPVSVLAAGADTVWAGSAAGVQGWTSDLGQPLRQWARAPGVTAVRSLAIVGATLQALVTTAGGRTALLRLTAPGGAARLSPSWPGPVSLVPGIPALVAHTDPSGSVAVAADPAPPGSGPVGRPLTADASIWPALRLGTARWLASSATSSALECFDATGDLVGRTSVGDNGRGVLGPVTTTARAVYAVAVGGLLARGGRGSCGAAPAR